MRKRANRAIPKANLGAAAAKRPGLRFDKVAVGLVRRVQTNLRDATPPGVRVSFAVSAPIRLPAKTAEELEKRVRALLRGRRKRVENSAMVLGNSVYVRIERNDSSTNTDIVGFVHNPDVDPRVILAEIGAP